MKAMGSDDYPPPLSQPLTFYDVVDNGEDDDGDDLNLDTIFDDDENDTGAVVPASADAAVSTASTVFTSSEIAFDIHNNGPHHGGLHYSNSIISNNDSPYNSLGGSSFDYLVLQQQQQQQQQQAQHQAQHQPLLHQHQLQQSLQPIQQQQHPPPSQATTSGRSSAGGGGRRSGGSSGMMTMFPFCNFHLNQNNNDVLMTNNSSRSTSPSILSVQVDNIGGGGGGGMSSNCCTGGIPSVAHASSATRFGETSSTTSNNVDFGSGLFPGIQRHLQQLINSTNNDKNNNNKRSSNISVNTTKTNSISFGIGDDFDDDMKQQDLQKVKQQQQQQQQPQPQKHRAEQQDPTQHVVGDEGDEHEHDPVTTNDIHTNTNTNNNKKAAEQLLNEQLQKLSMKERQQVNEDIHGTTDLIDESSNVEFMKSLLERFDIEVIKLRKRHGRIKTSKYCLAYEKALFLNPQLIEYDVDFKLMFIRADNYNPELAANRYMLYFTTKLELFGLDKLVKQPITYQDDLTTEDKDILHSGIFQCLSSKDRVGRPILIIFPSHVTTKLTKHHFRAMWYLRMSMIEQDVIAQRKGVVEIAYLIGGTNQLILPDPEMPQQVEASLPIRHVAMHIVHENKGNIFFSAFMGLLPMFAPMFKFIRFRTHNGKLFFFPLSFDVCCCPCGLGVGGFETFSSYETIS